jgi:hypothetical protein
MFILHKIEFSRSSTNSRVSINMIPLHHLLDAVFVLKKCEEDRHLAEFKKMFSIR